MPPSYMVVDIRWDDYAEESSEELELVQLQDTMKKIFHNTPPPILPDRKR